MRRVTADDQLIPTGTILGERYRVGRPLTSGGMSAVFVADDLKYPGRERAVKVMAPFLLKDARSRARFEQEALIGRALKHAHIVDVLAAGVDPTFGSPWIAMELLTGDTLFDVAKKRGPLPADEVRKVFVDFASAITAAHKAGVLHRDLKPENLFFEAKPSKSLPYTVKVLDFGIAKIKKDVTTQNSQLIGSPLWMAPEQLSQGSTLDQFTDVWPFGLLAFFALTGKPYWLVANEASPNLPKLLTEIMANEVVPPSKRAAELGASVVIPPAFDAWFAECVAREPAARFPTIADASRALDRALASMPAPAIASASASVAADAVDATPSPSLAAPSALHHDDPVTLPTTSRAPLVAVALGLVLVALVALAWWLHG